MICVRCHRTVEDGPFCSQCGSAQKSTRSARKRGNGTGTVFKRGSKWYAQVTRYIYTEEEDGKIKQIRRYKTKGGFSTKREALDYIDTLKSGEVRTVPTLLDLYNAWAKTELPKLGKSKQQAYAIARKRLEPIIGRKVDSVTTDELQSLVDEKADTFYKARDMKTLLSHLFKRATADQFVTQNLSQFIVLPVLNEKEGVPFNPDEVDKMWTAYADGNVFIGYLLLMVYSGMMPAELFSCRKDMIDFDKCEIWGCGRKTKKRKEVPIVFAECVKPVLVELCETVDGDMLQPEAKNAWYDRYHREVQAIGIRDLPPYSCRHTTGTEAAKQNLNASTIQKIMRHSKITTSQKYIHLGSSEVHAGLDGMKSMTNG